MMEISERINRSFSKINSHFPVGKYENIAIIDYLLECYRAVNRSLIHGYNLAEPDWWHDIRCRIDLHEMIQKYGLGFMTKEQNELLYELDKHFIENVIRVPSINSKSFFVNSYPSHAKRGSLIEDLWVMFRVEIKHTYELKDNLDSFDENTRREMFIEMARNTVGELADDLPIQVYKQKMLEKYLNSVNKFEFGPSLKRVHLRDNFFVRIMIIKIFNVFGTGIFTESELGTLYQLDKRLQSLVSLKGELYLSFFKRKILPQIDWSDVT